MGRSRQRISDDKIIGLAQSKGEERSKEIQKGEESYKAYNIFNCIIRMEWDLIGPRSDAEGVIAPRDM